MTDPVFEPPELHAVRDERPHDAASVAAVQRAAFGRAAEAELVVALQRAGVAPVSLVIGDSNGAVVAHVLFSCVTIDGRDAPRGVGLGPVAVLPERQRSGAGTRVICAGLERCRGIGFAYAVVLGDPAYYSRFGFLPATQFGLRCEFPVPPAAFMALELEPGALAASAGTVRYAPEFDRV